MYTTENIDFSVNPQYVVRDQANFIKAMEAIGLKATVIKTRHPDWVRIAVDDFNESPPRCVANAKVYCGRVAFLKIFYAEQYWHAAIRLILEKRLVLDPINLYSLGVKAYNAVYKDREETRTSNFLKLWRILFRDRYFGDIENELAANEIKRSRKHSSESVRT